MTNDIVIFKNGELELEVTVTPENDTVWLTQQQMAELFDKERSVITKHIGNIFKEKELDKDSNVQNLHIANSDRPVSFYNLDVIISVGYRVKSPNGIIFRKWATSILKDYIIKGYAVNKKYLEVLNKTIENQSRMLARPCELDKK